ncbi:conjugative transfer signal peptidase TraF [Pantoea sp. Mb-10]|uniref:conjugative transfer signal peptidase TraF n=1 Tax=unclassified Pantoea TaxID=2630326 RepID=UPI001E405DD2|nr:MULTISPECIES: conjugative transfer signal peptidase TraF [unclassified Pantoea]MCE0491188.1 conjugative transfer signal peptidase TraF [Pantoea sp. Mb-10]MCE0502677.1 conjugative transfer signal peptidase TraF [Pantoea sp. Pb-8]
MKSVIRLATLSILIVASLGAILCGLGYVAGVRVNITSSIPVGLYKIASRAPHKGDYVIFCPPEHAIFSLAHKRGYIGSGFCPAGYGEMMKQIVAVEGDSVGFRTRGVYVNGQRLAFSAPLTLDPSGRPLPALRMEHTMGKGELLLMTDQSASSFDARYFGPVTASQVVAVVSPLLIWRSVNDIAN